MTGHDYSNEIAQYLSTFFAARGLSVFREVDIGRSVLGSVRRVDVLAVLDKRALAIECKYQNVSGSAEEKIVHAIEDIEKIPMPAVLCYAGKGFSRGILARLEASQAAVHARPLYCDAWELDCVLAMAFGWWDLVTKKKEQVKFNFIGGQHEIDGRETD